MKFGQNVGLDKILDELENGSKGGKKPGQILGKPWVYLICHTPFGLEYTGAVG